MRYLLQDVTDIVLPEAKKANVKLEANPFDGPHLMVCGSQLHVRQVLVNLLDNAVRHNHEGELFPCNVVNPLHPVMSCGLNS